MSVYIDELRDYSGGPKWQYGKYCHLIADSEEELHAAARNIRLERSWHQASPPHSISHYDLTEAQREAIVSFGVREVTSRELVKLARKIQQRRDSVQELARVAANTPAVIKDLFS